MTKPPKPPQRRFHSKAQQRKLKATLPQSVYEAMLRATPHNGATLPERSPNADPPQPYASVSMVDQLRAKRAPKTP